MVNPADLTLQTFNLLIAQLEGGALNDELTEKVRLCVSEVADACADRGGVQKASITLRLDFEMNAKDRYVEIAAVINEKLPKAPRGRAGIFFCDDQGNLLRENPRQMTFDDVAERRRQRAGEAE